MARLSRAALHCDFMSTFKEDGKLTPLQGKMLLADPMLRDGVFERAVVLLSQHSVEDGAFGVILNHPINQVVGDFLKDKMFYPLRHVAVHQGGPVAMDQLFFATLQWNGEQGLRFVSQMTAEQAIRYHQQPGSLVRAFVGYSGWSPGQLEQELKRQTWIVCPPSPSLLGHEHDQSLWASTLRELSPYHRLLAEAPKNPFAN